MLFPQVGISKDAYREAELLRFIDAQKLKGPIN